MPAYIRQITPFQWLICLAIFGASWSTWHNPGYFSHDELAYLGSSFSLHPPESQLGSGFFRPLGMVAIWALVNLTPAPQVAHFLALALHAVNVWLLRRSLIQAGHENPELAALLFGVSPLAAFSVGWTAAVFDLGWACCGLLGWSLFQRLADSKRSWANLAGITVLYACGLLFKETALTLPLLFAAWMVIRRVKPSRLHCIAFASLGAVTLLYLIARLHHLNNMAQHGGGGYGLADLAHIGRNATAYWVFAITPWLVEVQQVWTALGRSAIFISALVHLTLVHGLSGRRSRRTCCYVSLFYLPLLPVLFISKHETQYLYATAATSAACLTWASTGKPQRWGMLVFIALAAYHSTRIHRSFEQDGLCQREFLTSINATSLPTMPSGTTLRFHLDEHVRRPWVIMRALVHTPIIVAHGLRAEIVPAEEQADLLVDAGCRVQREGAMVF